MSRTLEEERARLPVGAPVLHRPSGQLCRVVSLYRDCAFGDDTITARVDFSHASVVVPTSHLEAEPAIDRQLALLRRALPLVDDDLAREIRAAIGEPQPTILGQDARVSVEGAWLLDVDDIAITIGTDGRLRVGYVCGEPWLDREHESQAEAERSLRDFVRDLAPLVDLIAGEKEEA